ncbi:MAG: hypothetical protein ACM3W4_06455 [Ignavibacteriales bacterium]
MANDQPGLFGAFLIALAGGWAASRILHSRAEPFQALGLGIGGAVLGMVLSGAFDLELNAVGLLLAAIMGGLAVLACCRIVAHRLARRRERNRTGPDEFPMRETQEEP